MPRASKRKYHYIYKIIREDGKYYIGMHSTDDLDDGYFGSGTLLWKSINKHGKEKHRKEILQFLDSREELKLREKELVNEELLGDVLCMNLQLGGFGGWDYINKLPGHGVSGGKASGKKAMSLLTSNEEIRRKRVETRRSRHGSIFVSFSGKTHSDETKKQIGSKVSANQAGEGNSQFGSMWITNGSINMKVKKTDSIPDGWNRGRTMR